MVSPTKRILKDKTTWYKKLYNARVASCCVPGTNGKMVTVRSWKELQRSTVSQQGHIPHDHTCTTYEDRCIAHLIRQIAVVIYNVSRGEIAIYGKRRHGCRVSAARRSMTTMRRLVQEFLSEKKKACSALWNRSSGGTRLIVTGGRSDNSFKYGVSEFALGRNSGAFIYGRRKPYNAYKKYL